jgi:hypothetical protein
MAIKTLSKAQFDAFNPARGPMIGAIATEKAWFADDAGNVIGTVLLDRTDNDWNYVILGRDERGAFRWIQGDSSFETRDRAEQKLIEAMAKIEESGETVFPQGD